MTVTKYQLFKLQWGPGGSRSYVIGSNNSYKPITNTAWVSTRLCKLQKGCTRLPSASDKVYQLLAHGRWFSPGTPNSSTTKTGRHDIAEILLKVALKHHKSKSINQIAMDRFLLTYICLLYRRQDEDGGSRMYCIDDKTFTGFHYEDGGVVCNKSYTEGGYGFIASLLVGSMLLKYVVFCVVFLFFLSSFWVLCPILCMFLWIVHAWMFIKEKIKQWWSTIPPIATNWKIKSPNSSININKANTIISSELTEHITRPRQDVGNQGLDLRQAQTCGGVIYVDGISAVQIIQCFLSDAKNLQYRIVPNNLSKWQ